MTDPLRPAGASPAPATIDIEPITISASPSAGAPAVPLPVGDIAADCLSKLDGALLAVIAAPSHPVIATLAAIKSGLELGQCAAETINHAESEASVRQAIERCASEGGTPIGLLPGELTCGVPPEAP